MASCCYLAPVAVINLADPCVCNMPGGGTLALSNGDIYIRTTVTTPCNASDWQLISGASCNCSFILQDGFTNSQTIAGGDTLNIIAQNGIAATVSATDILTISGLTTFSNIAPDAAPAISTDVNFHLNCLTSTLYAWCPSTAAWINVSGSFTCANLNGCSIDSLSDVDTTTVAPVVGQALIWNGTNWVNTTLIVADCEAVQDCMSTALPFATYNDALNTYSLGSINFHSDVDTVTTPPTVGQVLSWDGTNWIPSAISCEAVQDCMSTALPFTTYNDVGNTFALGSIDFHSDVDTVTVAPIVNQVLSWNGTNWVPTTITAFTCEDVQDCMSTALPFTTYNDVGNTFALGSIDFHSDVDTTTTPPSTNQALVWDGANWIPGVATCPAVGQSTVHYGYNGTNYGFFNVRQKLNYRSVAANTALVPSTDGVIGVNAAGGNRVITLVTPSTCDPQDFWIKRLDNVVANTVTVTATTIDGVVSIVLNVPGPFSTSMGEAVHVMHIGTNNWIVI